jgi:DNA-binding response OmpR family regulator
MDMRLLLVTHDPTADKKLKNNLSIQYMVDVVSTCERALYQFEVNDYALVILDVQLPDGSGLDLCRQWRTNLVCVPILFLTEAGDQKTIVTALNLGADDCMTKPFEFDELSARLECLLRRQTLLKPAHIRHEDLLLDVSSYQASYGSQLINFRRKEWQILELLIRHRGQVVTHGMLWEHVWESSNEIKSNVIEVHLSSIRRKLAKHYLHCPIETVKPLGYRWLK